MKDWREEFSWTRTEIDGTLLLTLWKSEKNNFIKYDSIILNKDGVLYMYSQQIRGAIVVNIHCLLYKINKS